MTTPVLCYNSAHSAAESFVAARAGARRERLLAHLRGRPFRLIPFAEASRNLGPSTPGPRQRQDIPAGQIVGSVGRQHDYTRAFRPLRGHDAMRWAGVKRAVESQHGLPPVEVYKIGDSYFVLDGHHRVSVLRHMRAAYVEAFVTELRPLNATASAPSPASLAGSPVKLIKCLGAWAFRACSLRRSSARRKVRLNAPRPA